MLSKLDVVLRWDLIFQSLMHVFYSQQKSKQ